EDGAGEDEFEPEDDEVEGENEDLEPDDFEEGYEEESEDNHDSLEEGEEGEDNDPVIGEGLFMPTSNKVILEKNLDVAEVEDKHSGETMSLLGGNASTLSEFGIEKENYTLTFNNEVPISKIVISEPIKKGRSATIVGLTKTVGELGVVTPIHVLRLETAGDEDSDLPEYQLIDGLRRMYSSIKNDLKTIPTMIWDFKDKAKGRQAALILGLTLNRTQKRRWSEIWELYNILEMQSQIKPATFESLFQLEGGDAMKLKDVMFSEYPEVKEELLDNIKTLDQAYKQLQKLRKDENALEIEDNTGFSDSSEMAKEIVEGEEQPVTQLSNDEVLSILEMGDSFGKDVDGSDFGAMEGMFNEVTHQSSKDRKPIDPYIKQQTFARDDYSCKCCGLHGRAFLSTLVYHHIIPVHAGGPDTVENGLTICDSCHITLHVIEKNGRLPITQEEFDKYQFEDQLRIKNILHYARLAIIAGKQKGLTEEQRRKLAQQSARHRMPGEGHKENQQGFALYQKALEDTEKMKEETAS
ncbi:HNH endonuclease, partial [Bacillus toyonensis]|uniref:HNH endonuclease n=1 Tax=Bacillus toyonensis TaxID=155322 RepID=UPI0011458D9E